LLKIEPEHFVSPESSLIRIGRSITGYLQSIT